MIYKLCINNAGVKSQVYLTMSDAAIVAGFNRIIQAQPGDVVKLSETMELKVLGGTKWEN